MKMEITLPMIRIATILLLTAILASTALFLYRDFYQTIVQARVVVVLKQEVSLENINLNLFNKVFETNSYKTKSALSENIYDPFKTSSAPIAPDADEE